MRSTLDTLRREAESTIRVFYALQYFNNLLTNREHVNKVNKNVYFWKIYESSLQTKLFIGIRRLFESKSDSFSFSRAMKMVKENLEDFQPTALEMRKIADQPKRPDWLDEYMQDVYTPNEEDLNNLARLVRENSKRMKNLYTEAASKVFAHAVHTDTEAINGLMGDMNFAEIEQALNAVWHFYQQVWQMYENGREPLMEIVSYPYREEVEQCILKQISGKA